MATKDNFLLFEKQHKFINNCGTGAQYSDLNLNQNLKGLNIFPIQPNSKSYNNEKIDYTLSESYEGKEKSQTWKMTDLCSKYSTNLSLNGENEKCWKKNGSSNATNNSTLSLRISAYENSNEVSSDSFNKSFQKSVLIQKQKQINLASKFVSQNPFEFQRQRNDKVPEPEVSQFKASQRLLNSNKSGLHSVTPMTWKTSAFVERLKKPVLVVGAGGIGCELLKNLALTGFTKIHVVDLDTIDISNLNRQFLFRKEHVGKSKAEVATAAVKTMTPGVDITFDHGSITSEKYDVDFFKGFTFVFNALDNKAARAHVNRLCLAADIPLFESGSAGYKGNVFVIMKGKTECFECLGKPVQKTFPGCTIRNTPSEMIHCVVWAKSVFNQLFGEEDPDDAVSPNFERERENGNTNGKSENDEDKKPVGPSLRMTASQAGYDSKEIFNKLYNKDISYLLTMEDLWKDRRPPNPLSWEGNSAAGTETITNKIWPIQTWEGIFTEAVKKLKKNFEEAEAKGNVLIWDKDDDVAMNFVSAAANIRAHIFHIPMKSTFDIKSMAGNIIPAIATTNAVVAGMIVVEAIRVIRGGAADLRAAYTNAVPIASRLVSSSAANPPNPKCFVCGGGNTEVKIAVNLEAMKVSIFEEQVLKKGLSVIEPDIIDLGTNNVIISSDGDTDGTKTLYAVGVRNGTRLDCDDFKQDFSVKIQVQHEPSFDAVQFELREDEPMKEEAKKTTQNETGLIKESMEIDEVSHMKNLKRAAATKIDENIELPTKKQKISN